jgi:hypothetical protein
MVQMWCFRNYIQKTNVTAFYYETSSIHLNCHIGDLIHHTNFVKDVGVMLDTKLYFDQCVNYVYLQFSSIYFVPEIHI